MWAGICLGNQEGVEKIWPSRRQVQLNELCHFRSRELMTREVGACMCVS
jgi:hypothetical protein